jgi:hypothetical protein
VVKVRAQKVGRFTQAVGFTGQVVGTSLGQNVGRAGQVVRFTGHWVLAAGQIVRLWKHCVGRRGHTVGVTTVQIVAAADEHRVAEAGHNVKALGHVVGTLGQRVGEVGKMVGFTSSGMQRTRIMARLSGNPSALTHIRQVSPFSRISNSLIASHCRVSGLNISG